MFKESIKYEDDGNLDEDMGSEQVAVSKVIGVVPPNASRSILKKVTINPKDKVQSEIEKLLEKHKEHIAKLQKNVKIIEFKEIPDKPIEERKGISPLRK